MKLVPIGLYRIEGKSMTPAFAIGDRVVGWRWESTPGIGQIVVVKNNNDRLIIKRVIKINNHGLWLEGDNKKASTDSRQQGYYNAKAVEAIIIWPRV